MSTGYKAFRLEMKKHLHINRFLLKIRLVVLAVLLYCVFQNIGFAQDKDTEAFPIDMNDTLSFTKEQKGMFNKLAQIFKFRENRNRREKERIYNFMLQLVKDRDLSVDSNMNEIFKMLDTLKIADSIRTKELDEKILTNNLAIDSLKAVVIDSFEVEFKKTLDSVFKKGMEKYFTDLSKIDFESATTINQLRDINCSCDWLDRVEDSIKVGFDQCLSTKVKVIGWHNEWDKFRYENYDYRYLSAINLYGYYELKRNGEPKSWPAFNKLNETGVIEFSRQKNTNLDFYLTIHSKSANETNNFLKDSMNYNVLIEHLKDLRRLNKIHGVNIYFENLRKSDNKKFNAFISKVKEKLGEKFIVNVTIPSIYDEYSLEQAGSYDFPILIPMVNQFILSTDRMVRYDSDWAQPNSPLNKNEIPEFGTIASNVNFYNKKIPIDKLIVSVSYLGQEWPVTSDFSGEVKRYYRGNKANDIEYSLIMRYYKNNKKVLKSLEEGYDSIQKSAYINVIDESNYFEPRYYKIWYENKQSLTSKYNWILKNNLAGVSIRGLGYDDGYSDLWEAIGSTLVNVESRPELKKELRQECKFGLFKTIKELRREYDLEFKDKKIYKSDTLIYKRDTLLVRYSESNINFEELRFPVDLSEALQLKILDRNSIQMVKNNDTLLLDSLFDKYINTSIFDGTFNWSWSDFVNVSNDSLPSSIWYKFQWYHYKNEEPKFKFLKSLGLYSDYKWAEEPETYIKTEYGKKMLESGLLDESTKLDYEKYFEDSAVCICSYKRLIIFSNLSFYGSAICLFICLLCLYWMNWLNRYNRGTVYLKFGVKLITLLIGAIAVMLLFYGLYMTPYFNSFGASNHGETSLNLYLIIMLLGVLLGLFIYSRYAKARFLTKDLP